MGEEVARGVPERDGVGAASVRIGGRGRDRRRRMVAVGGQRDGVLGGRGAAGEDGRPGEDQNRT
jgi:hypothetical protein